MNPRDYTDPIDRFLGWAFTHPLTVLGWMVGVTVGLQLLRLSLRFLRGRWADWRAVRRSPFGRAKWATSFRELRQAKLLTIGGLFLGRWRGTWFRSADLFRSHERRHLMTIAGTGAGKTTGLVIPALCELRDCSVIVTDPKAQVAIMTQRHRRDLGPVVFINPWAAELKEGTGVDLPDSGFNPLSVLKHGPNLVDDARRVARFLLVTDRAGSDNYWTDEASGLLAGLLVWMIEFEPPENQTLVFLWWMLRDSTPAFEQRLEWMIGEKNPFLRGEGQRLLDLIKTPAQWRGVIAKAQLAVGNYSPESPLGIHTAKSGFDLSELKRKNITVYLMVPASRASVAASWLNLLMCVIGIAIAQPGPSRPVYVLFEEFPALGYLPDLRNQLRTAGEAGLKAWIFSQTKAAIAAPELYGENGFKDLQALCETRLYFGITERELAEDISKTLGEKSSINRTLGSVHLVAVPLMRTEEILRLRRGDMIIFQGDAERPVRAQLAPYWTRPAWASLVDRNPYRA